LGTHEAFEWRGIARSVGMDYDDSKRQLNASTDLGVKRLSTIEETTGCGTFASTLFL
jgi:hypothetical protein